MPSGHGERLSRDQDRAIAALLESKSIAQAAGKAGVSYRALQQWLLLPGFDAAYRVAKAQLVERAIGHVCMSLQTGLEALAKLCKDGTPEQRMEAAGKLLDVGLRGIEGGDFVRRLKELEAFDEARVRQIVQEALAGQGKGQEGGEAPGGSAGQ